MYLLYLFILLFSLTTIYLKEKTKTESKEKLSLKDFYVF